MDMDAIDDTLELNGWCSLSSFGGSPNIVVNHLGRVIPVGKHRADFTDLIPYSISAAPPKSMSSIVGLSEQPMHTDRAHSSYPPRYVMLQCLDPGEETCPTVLWIPDAHAMQTERARFLNRAQWVFHNGLTSAFYAPIADRVSTRLRVRFDRNCMYAASFSDCDVSVAEEFLASHSERVIIEWHPNALLIIDNWRLLHSRGLGAEKAPSRCLRRWYIGE